MPIASRFALLLVLAAGCGRAERPGARADSPASADSTVAAPEAGATTGSVAGGVAACAGAAGRDSLCFHATRAHDFAGDGHPFQVTVDARGPAADSMQVTLRITRGDTVFHRADWTTALYGRYDDRPAAPDSARRRTASQFARLLTDSAFRPAAAFLGTGSGVDRTLRETIAFDVAVAGERERRGLTAGDTLPTAAAQSPRPVRDDDPAVAALATELRDAPAFRYHAGGEATYAVAWSPRAHRFVVVSACC